MDVDSSNKGQIPAPPLKRISAQAIKQLLREAEEEFSACLRVVGALSGYRVESTSADELIAFQKRLYDTIFQLEQVFHVIRREERRIITRKSLYKKTWFRQRMSRLAVYNKVIKKALVIGRAIGDGYAWFFYERDPNLIDEHLKMQAQALLPTSIGGAGERITMERIRGVDGKLLLYHGITSMLRIGDITFIDLETMRVACLGEIKTCRSDDHHITVSISMIAGERSGIPEFPVPKRKRSGKPPPSLAGSARDRFQRQRTTMQEAMTQARAERSDHTISQNSTFHYSDLEDLVNSSVVGKFNYIHASPGLLMAALRLPESSELSLEAAGRQATRLVSSNRDLPEQVTKILARDIAWNSLSLGGLGDEKELAPTESHIPFFAWPVDPDVLADIAFGRVIVVTMFNSGHMIKWLSDKGFSVEVDRKARLVTASMSLGNKVLQLERFDFFLSLVQSALMTEEAVKNMIDDAIEKTTSLSADHGSTRVDLVPRIRRASAQRWPKQRPNKH